MSEHYTSRERTENEKYVMLSTSSTGKQKLEDEQLNFYLNLLRTFFFPLDFNWS